LGTQCSLIALPTLVVVTPQIQRRTGEDESNSPLLPCPGFSCRSPSLILAERPVATLIFVYYLDDDDAAALDGPVCLSAAVYVSLIPLSPVVFY
jgi:hypothetical protein